MTISNAAPAANVALEIEDLLNRQVSSLVSATADAVAATGSSMSVLELEAHFYRSLAVNCENKARMMEGFAKRQPKEETQ
jgi:hypothetical protein